MPTQPFRPTPPPYPGSWYLVASAEEARRWESEETVRRPMAAIDYDRAQDERWAKLAPSIITALDRLFGQPSKLAPPAPVVLEGGLEHDGLVLLEHLPPVYWDE